jgi:UDP-N-acetylmuramoylalanine--D-glutamate ligase
MDRFAGKTVVVMGLGRFGGGTDAVTFMSAQGAQVIVTDAAPAERLVDSVRELEGIANVEFHLGGHLEADFRHADLIVVNPAVPDTSPFLEIARKHNRSVTTAMNLFLQGCPAPIIGITGANGKSTTTALAAHLLQAAIGGPNVRYKNVWLSGNIGNVPLLGLLDQIRPNDVVVLELSSFQTERFSPIQKAPKVALLTNLTPNHLDRHGTFETYCAAKENLFRYQPLDPADPALSLFFAEDPVGQEWFKRYSGQPGRICRTFSPDDVSTPLRGTFKLPGRANLCNLAAALAIVRNYGVTDRQVEQALPSFKSLPHRLELVGEVKGVRYYNDSIATTPESAIVALTAFDEPKVIIAGGSDKGVSYDAFARVVAQRAKAAILVGATAEKIGRAIQACSDSRAHGAPWIVFAQTFQEAVVLAGQHASPGDVVLLSPACASFDMFDNFQHRGREFARLVGQLQA